MVLEPIEDTSSRRLVTAEPGIVRLSMQTYRMLAFAYPAVFRVEYAVWMEQAFRDQCLRTYRARGAIGMPRLWADTLLDWVKTVVEQHSRKGLTMNRSMIIRAGGLCLILSGVVMVLGAMSTLLYSGTTDPQNFLFRPYDPWLFVGTRVWFPAFSLLTAAGLLGLFARYGAAGGFGSRVALLVGALGGITAFAFFTVLVLTEDGAPPGTWDRAMIGVLVLFGGLLVFGIFTLYRRLLASWSWLPLATALWFFVMVLISMSFTPEPPEALLMVFFTVLTVGLILLGRRLLYGVDVPAMAWDGPDDK